MLAAYLQNMKDLDVTKFQGVSMIDSTIIEELITINFFIYVIDMQDGALVWGSEERSLEK